MTEENSALVSTDVLARGIDIPYVDHVIHYQVPRTTEIYVHRSGRTARAKSEGISIILVDPDERPSFKNIAQVLNKENENNISQFPVDEKFMPQIRKRVNLAIQLNKLIHDKQKISFEKKNWFVKKSEELDLPLDDDLLDVQDENDEIYKESKKNEMKIESLKNNLKVLLSTPIFQEGISKSYITRNKIKSLSSFNTNALEDMKNS